MHRIERNRRVRMVGPALLAALGGVAAAAVPAGTLEAARPLSGRGGCTCAAAPSPVRYVIPALRRAGDEPAAAKLYVADEVSGTVSVVDAVSRERIATILVTVWGELPVPFAPRGVAVAPDGGSVWVTAPQPMSNCVGDESGCGGEVPLPPELKVDEVVVIDPLTDSIVTRIRVPSLDTGNVHVNGIAIDPESRFAYVTATAVSQVIRIDMQTREIAGRVDLGPGREPEGIVLCGEMLVVANGFGGQSLSLVSTTTGAVDEIPLGGVAQQTACTSDGQFAFVSLFDKREVVRYEFATGELQRLALPEGAEGPVQVQVSPDDKLLYVCDQGTLFGRMPSDKVYLIDIASGDVKDAIAVGQGPNGITLSDDGTHAYITNFLGASVSILDLKKGEVLGNQVQVGSAPKGIGYWPGAKLVQ